MNTEIEDMLSSLMPDSKDSSAKISQGKSDTPTTTVKLLSTPIGFLVKVEYTGKNYKHLVVKPGDQVVVCARDNQFALAYCLRNNMAGRIPLEHLEKEESQSAISSAVCLALLSRKGNLRNGNLVWKAGEYIRVYKWDDHRKISGIGLNLATKEIGRFYGGTSDLKVLE